MIELYNFIRAKSIAGRKRNSIKCCASAGHKAKQHIFFQSRAGSPEAVILGTARGSLANALGQNQSPAQEGMGRDRTYVLQVGISYHRP